MDNPDTHGGWESTINGNNNASSIDHADQASSRHNHHLASTANGETISSGSNANGWDGEYITASAPFDNLPPEIMHITGGFFPLAKGINRVVVQCWDDLASILSEMGDGQAPQRSSSAQASGNNKKGQILGFLQAKRAEFIKLLVLSQWSRQSIEVGKLIDIQAFIRQRYESYNLALFRTGSMKRDLSRAQMGNPDLQTALEAISTEITAATPTLGFLPPGTLSSTQMLLTLLKINKLINIRLMLHDKVPEYVTYVTHDGRVTFTVLHEFELDLSIAHESPSSQFFFVDLRFTFSPASPISKGQVRDNLEHKLNATLLSSGLTGCFEFLHSLVLTQKIIICFRQAITLNRSFLGDNLRVELLHRTLIIQYWVNRPGPKNWIEIGISTNKLRPGAGEKSHLYIRWSSDHNKLISVENEHLNGDSISLESILHCVISRHISNVLLDLYKKLSATPLYGRGGLYIGLNTSTVEPGNCWLDIHLTNRKRLKVVIEPVNGGIKFQAVPSSLNRFDNDIDTEKGPDGDAFDRICRIRCLAALEEVETHGRALGWSTINPHNLDISSLRRGFPADEVRNISIFQHKEWDRSWAVAFTSGMGRDNWWAVQLQRETSLPSIGTEVRPNQPLQLRQVTRITESCTGLGADRRYSTFAKRAHALVGVVMAHSVSSYLSKLRLHYLPPIDTLVLDTQSNVPSIFVHFQRSSIPPQFETITPLNHCTETIIGRTIRLSYGGVDHRSGHAIMVVRGYILPRLLNINIVSTPLDPVLIFRPSSRRFAMRFLIRVGEPIVARLYFWLQTLSNTILALGLLRAKKFRPISVSLSRIKFTYPELENLGACISFKYLAERAIQSPAMASHSQDAASTSRLHLSLDFSHKNPHWRIIEPLTVILNDHQAGLGFTLELLSATLPLLQVFEAISSGPKSGSRCLVRVTARNAKVYQIIYPSIQYRFHVIMRQRRQRIIWLLHNYTMRNIRNCQANLQSELTSKIFTTVGDGWRGLGEGVIADAEKVVNIILLLHGLVKAHIYQSHSSSVSDGEPKAD
ncbi:mediator complex subunit [Myotisia sp. PD_48]|nr:mediator complex subunit [Myotisia sp. PD_48]